MPFLDARGGGIGFVCVTYEIRTESITAAHASFSSRAKRDDFWCSLLVSDGIPCRYDPLYTRVGQSVTFVSAMRVFDPGMIHALCVCAYMRVFPCDRKSYFVEN